MKVKSLAVVLERQQQAFRPGELVSGQCVLVLEGEMHLSQLTVHLKGEALCEWSEHETHQHYNHQTGKHESRKELRRYHTCHPVINLAYLPGNVYPSVLNNGQHNIGFNFQLPVSQVPSSFEGDYGSIRYSIEAHIHKTEFFSMDERRNIPIIVTSPAFASIQELGQCAQNSNHKTVGFFGGQTVQLRCNLQRIGHNIGTTIPINCFIDNKSKKSMTLRAALKQEVVFHAQGKTKKTESKIVRCIGNVLPGNSQMNEVLSLLVPINTPVVHNCCPIIIIKYTIVVTLDIPGSFDLHCDLPVILTNESLPFDHQ